ncbi:MAG: hypothetical protein HYZ11_00905 [Candidatus Tectomicrobia bacterium]|uniref:Uncharacterized protein n=1 Tax=Tectimicrobiota bacterium TaxID=2528274 RepID=A0A932MNF8_UNCTE|nr:hypothetical protein [Candidatus Tectomicrobia bacterium]
MNFLKNVQAQWNAWVPFMKGAAVGVIVGPLFTLYMGWMVTSGNVTGQVEAALVNARASICVARARAAEAAVKDPSSLDWSARRALAEKWSLMPGQKAGTAEYAVTNACAEMLAEPVKNISKKETPS